MLYSRTMNAAASAGAAPESCNDPALDPVISGRAFAAFARSRRSIRRYTDQPVAPSLLAEILECARWVPSAHNRQPWRFCVVISAGAKEQLSRRMGERWRADLTADGADPDFVAQRVRISHARITGAAALVIACMSMEDMDTYPDAARAEAEWTMATQSVALACQNLLLAAHANGLAACWMCAPLFVAELVVDELALPPTWQPQALITLGYAAEEKSRERQPIENYTIWR